MKKLGVVLLTCAFAIAMALSSIGCSSGSGASSAATSPDASASSNTSSASALENGTYSVKVETDSSMFHLNETKNGRDTLKVKNGEMTVHMTLVSKKIENVYAGTSDEAKADEAGIIQPTTDKVIYSDGYEEEVYGFDIPVPALDEPFDVAILGNKGKWYDHKVTVSDPIPE